MDKLTNLLKRLEETYDQIDLLTKEAKYSREKVRSEKQLLASSIKVYRAKHGLSQEQLAEKLGVGRLSIIRWEGAVRLPCNLAQEKLIKVGIIRK